jgi:hypothetical protein
MAWEFLVGLGSTVLGKKIDSISNDKGKIKDKRIDLYERLWVDLIDLKDIMNELWVKLDEPTFNKYVEQLKKTKKIINSKRIFLEKKEYLEIKKLLETLENYQIGKKKLLEDGLEREFDAAMVPALVNDLKNKNYSEIEKFEKLINQLEEKVKKFIGIKN